MAAHGGGVHWDAMAWGIHWECTAPPPPMRLRCSRGDKGGRTLHGRECWVGRERISAWRGWPNQSDQLKVRVVPEACSLLRYRERKSLLREHGRSEAMA